MGKILQALKRRPPRANLPRPPRGAKHYTITISQDESGFIPALQFSSSNLELALTQAIWAYVCMTRIAEDISQMPVVPQVLDGKDWRTDPDHELAELVAQPFGKQAPNGPALPRWSFKQLIEAMSLHKHIRGNSYLHAPTPSGNPRRLLALQLFLDPGGMDVTEDPRSKAAAAYNYGGVTYDPAKIVNVMTANPSSFYRGISPLAAAGTAIQIDAYAQERIKSDLTQRLAPGLIVQVAGLYGLDDEDRTEIEDILTENFGKAEQSGLPLVTGDGTEIIKAPSADYLKDLPEHQQRAAKQIWAVFKFPPPVAGDMDAATLQNAQVALRLYWMQALQPQILSILDPINGQAVQPAYGRKVRLYYELADNELGLAVLKERAGIAKILTDIGYSANDAAARVSLGMDWKPELEKTNQKALNAGRPEPESSDKSGTDGDTDSSDQSGTDDQPAPATTATA